MNQSNLTLRGATGNYRRLTLLASWRKQGALCVLAAFARCFCTLDITVSVCSDLTMVQESGRSILPSVPAGHGLKGP